jgi:hypothetical protein
LNLEPLNYAEGAPLSHTEGLEAFADGFQRLRRFGVVRAQG